MRGTALAIALLCASPALADGVTLRFAAIAPEGTAWAREVRAFQREIESLTRGGLHTKWYMGAIAGDELTVLERIKRGQLDGSAGALFCERIAPSVRVLRVVGLFRDHAEALYVLNRLRPILEKEFLQHGFVSLGTSGGFGEDVLFTRNPVRTLADLRRTRMWVWSLDDISKTQLAAMGVPVVALPVEEAARAYDDKRLDGWFAIPGAALNYQWSTQARYYTPLPSGFLPGCLVISTAAFDALPLEQQHSLKEAAARLLVHFEEVGKAQDHQLLNGLFERQGLTRVEVTPSLVNEFAAASRAARGTLNALIPPELMQMVSGWLDEYRAANRK